MDESLLLSMGVMAGDFHAAHGPGAGSIAASRLREVERLHVMGSLGEEDLHLCTGERQSRRREDSKTIQAPVISDLRKVGLSREVLTVVARWLNKPRVIRPLDRWSGPKPTQKSLAPYHNIEGLHIDSAMDVLEQPRSPDTS